VKFYEYALDIKRRLRLKAAFHAVYPFIINSRWDSYERMEIHENAPLLAPDRFVVFMKSVLNNFVPLPSTPKKLVRQTPERSLNISSVKNGAGRGRTRNTTRKHRN